MQGPCLQEANNRWIWRDKWISEASVSLRTVSFHCASTSLPKGHTKATCKWEVIQTRHIRKLSFMKNTKGEKTNVSWFFIPFPQRLLFHILSFTFFRFLFVVYFLFFNVITHIMHGQTHHERKVRYNPWDRCSPWPSSYIINETAFS